MTTYRNTLDEVSQVQYDNAMRRTSAAETHATPARNEIAEAAGMRPLDESDLQAFAGIEGDAKDARIGWDVEMFGGIDACLVLCEDALGVYWYDEHDNQHAWQMNGVARLTRELVAAELLKWDERHPGHELNEDILGRLGFESVY
jgi:hypothetical protein